MRRVDAQTRSEMSPQLVLIVQFLPSASKFRSSSQSGLMFQVSHVLRSQAHERVVLQIPIGVQLLREAG